MERVGMYYNMGFTYLGYFSKYKRTLSEVLR